MMTVKGPATVDPFIRSTSARLNGRLVEDGTELTVRGKGRVRFKAHVVNPRNGAEWLDVIDRRGRWASVRPEAVSTVHRLAKGRPAA